MAWTTRPRSDLGALRAIRAGAGPRVALLHGVGLRAEAWSPLIDLLAERFEVIAPDLPGHGESAAFAGAPGLVDYVERLADALPGPARLVGHSMGAMIALDLAIRRPDLATGVAALNAIYRRSPDAAAAVRARAASLAADGAADPEPTLQRWFGAAASPERDACRSWLTSVAPESYKAAYAVFASEDGPSDAGLAELRMPALFLTGADEPNSTPAMSEAMAARAPHGRAVVIAGAAHMAPMTHAAAVAAELTAFFEEGGA